MTEELKGDELDAILDDLSKRMDRLRVLYEQFFLGIEKIPPLQVQKDVVRILYRLQGAKLKGTTQKFRFQALIQLFNAHKAYWARTTREIEEGTYKRQMLRADSRRKRAAPTEAPGQNTDAEAVAMANEPEENGASAEAKRQAAHARELAAEADAFMAQLGGGPAPAQAPQREAGVAPKPAPDIRGMSADEVARKRAMLEELRNRVKSGSAGSPPDGAARRAAAAAAPRDPDREVFERFVAARQRNNEAVDALSCDARKRNLEAQRAKVREKHGVARVDFDVVEKDGRAFLKPVPVRE